MNDDDRSIETETDTDTDTDTAEDDDHTEAILAADDTGLVRNEVTITEVELREGELPPPV